MQRPPSRPRRCGRRWGRSRVPDAPPGRAAAYGGTTAKDAQIGSPSDTIVLADSRDNLDYVIRNDPIGTVYAPEYRHTSKALFGIYDGHITTYGPLQGVIVARWDCQVRHAFSGS